MTDAAHVVSEGWNLTGRIAPLGSGHINDTFVVGVGQNRWVLQRINAFVFAQPQVMMANVERVVQHVNRLDPGFVPALVSTVSGGWFHVDASGACWRLAQYVSDSRTLQRLENTDQARVAGQAFAHYQNLLADLPAPPLAEVIPGFLRLGGYLAQLDEALTQWPHDRPDRKDAAAGEPDHRQSARGEVVRWRAFIDERRWLATELQQASDYIHGDCKVNNLLFRRDADVVRSVVDLDTTMRGHWAWDFGDLVRSGADAGGSFSVELFTALARGFAGTLHRAVTRDELVLAPRYIALMLGVRFLADHLQGDRYFKIARHGDNLQRAQEQLMLLQQMEANEAAMLRCVRELP